MNAGKTHPTHAFSHALERLAHDPTRERISVGNVFDVMQERTLVALILLFALPNTVPVPPGTSAVLGAPLLLLTLQLTLGLQPWLPQSITARSMPRRRFADIMDLITPWLSRAERLLRPRLQALASPRASRWLGALFLVLASILVLPIPFGNMPPAYAICILALGLLQRDGLWVLAGIAIGLTSIAVAAAVVFLLFKTSIGLWFHLGV